MLSALGSLVISICLRKVAVVQVTLLKLRWLWQF